MKSNSLWKWFTGGIVGTVAVFFGIKNINTGAENEIPAQQASSTTQKDTSRTLYGLNGLVKFNKVGLSNEGFIKAIDSTKIDWFRYPGGTNANYANWRTDSPSLRSLQLLVQSSGMQIMYDLNILTTSLDD